MFDISITINGEKHTKSKPKMDDYRRLLEYNKRNQGKTFLTDAEPVEEAIPLVADWFGISSEDVEKQLDLAEIFTIYRQIESNITEVFTGVPLQTALKTLQKVKKQPIH